MKKYFRLIYSLDVDLNDKTAFDKWAISDSGKNKNKNELSDADFKIEIKSIQDNADNENISW